MGNHDHVCRAIITPMRRACPRSDRTAYCQAHSGLPDAGASRAECMCTEQRQLAMVRVARNKPVGHRTEAVDGTRNVHGEHTKITIPASLPTGTEVARCREESALRTSATSRAAASALQVTVPVPWAGASPGGMVSMVMRRASYAAPAQVAGGRGPALTSGAEGAPEA